MNGLVVSWFGCLAEMERAGAVRCDVVVDRYLIDKLAS